MKRKKSMLVTNKKGPEATLKTLQTVTNNIVPSHCRFESLEGRNHMVVPMVMLLQGVHHGSNGALLYSEEELGKTPEVWNHKPVVVYHPEINGRGISACDPDVINNRKVGIVLNTRWEAKTKRLVAEAWIEPERANLVDERIMEAVQNGEMMELSTGLFVDTEKGEGDWEGESYTGIARNFRPDHLALLPDKTGACSIKDGAGFLRNENKEPKKKRSKFLTDNEMSHESIADALRAQLLKRFPPGDNGPWTWIAAVYSNFLVYERDGKFFRLNYTASDTGATLSDDAPVEVERVVEFRTVEGAIVGNRDQTAESNTAMNKKEVVDGIITANAGWSEADRNVLMNYSESQLKTIQNGIPKPTAPQGGAPAAGPSQAQPVAQPAAGTTNNNAPAATPATAPAPAAAPTVTANANPQPAMTVVTVEDYIRTAPPEVAEVLRNSMSSLNEEKGRLVEAITKNANNPYSKDQLSNKPIGELRALAQLAGATTSAAPQPIYAGQGMVPTGNAGAPAGEEPLAVPTMNFEPAKK